MRSRILLPLLATLALVAACKSEPAQSAQPQRTAQAAQTPPAAKPVDGRIEIEATADGFTPSRIEAEAGKPLTLIFKRTVERSCMTAVVFPSLDIEEDLPLDTPVEIQVTPKAGETIGFECPMGHGKSTIRGI